jgi:hypothetical protein
LEGKFDGLRRVAFNFDEFKAGRGLHEKHAVATSDLVINSALALRQVNII